MSLIGSVAGLLVFLCLLTVAMQVLVGLHATSAVTAAAHDAARLASRSGGAPVGDDARTAAEAHARSLLGRFGDDVEFTWIDDDPDVIGLRVVAPAPRFLLPAVDGALGIDVIDRTVTVRIEQVQG